MQTTLPLNLQVTLPLNPQVNLQVNPQDFSGTSVYLPISQTLATDGIIVAQQFDQDIMGDVGKAFGNFVDSGQIWAMLAGFVIGYVFKSVTSYG